MTNVAFCGKRCNRDNLICIPVLPSKTLPVYILLLPTHQWQAQGAQCGPGNDCSSRICVWHASCVGRQDALTYVWHQKQIYCTSIENPFVLNLSGSQWGFIVFRIRIDDNLANLEILCQTAIVQKSFVRRR